MPPGVPPNVGQKCWTKMLDKNFGNFWRWGHGRYASCGHAGGLSCFQLPLDNIASSSVLILVQTVSIFPLLHNYFIYPYLQIQLPFLIFLPLVELVMPRILTCLYLSKASLKKSWSSEGQGQYFSILRSISFTQMVHHRLKAIVVYKPIFAKLFRIWRLSW